MEATGGFRRGSLTGKLRNGQPQSPVLMRMPSKLRRNGGPRGRNAGGGIDSGNDDIVDMYKKYTERRRVMEKSSNWFNSRPGAQIPVNSYVSVKKVFRTRPFLS